MWLLPRWVGDMVNIKFEDYISEEEKKAIVLDVYKDLVRSKMNTENDLKRILSNVSYDVFYSIVDDVFDNDSRQLVKSKVDNILSNPVYYNLFKKPDAWDTDSNEAYKHLQQCVKANRPVISAMVQELLEKQVVEACKKDVKDLMNEALSNYLRGF